MFHFSEIIHAPCGKIRIVQISKEISHYVHMSTFTFILAKNTDKTYRHISEML